MTAADGQAMRTPGKCFSAKPSPPASTGWTSKPTWRRPLAASRASNASSATTICGKERMIALGIPHFEELKHAYFYEQINRDTEVYGVIGDPIGHSLSPMIHNAAMRKLGINGVYIPFQVPRGELPTFLKAFDSIPVKG